MGAVYLVPGDNVIRAQRVQFAEEEAGSYGGSKSYLAPGQEGLRRQYSTPSQPQRQHPHQLTKQCVAALIAGPIRFYICV